MQHMQKGSRYMKKAFYRSKESGMTLIEVGVIVPIMIVFLLVLIDAMFEMVSTANLRRNDIYSTDVIQTAFNVMEKDISLASRFLPTKDDMLGDAYPPSTNGGTWSYRGSSDTSRALIVRTYATTGNPESITRRPVFLYGPKCNTSEVFYYDVLEYNTIYFLENNNLYRRRIVDRSTPTCTAMYQKQSCPSLDDLLAKGISTRDPSCEADDEIVASGVEEFSVKYYSRSSNATDMNVYSTPNTDQVIDATAVDITLTVKKKSMNRPSVVTSTARMSKLNIVSPAM